jgi:hypothetical protein
MVTVCQIDKKKKCNKKLPRVYPVAAFSFNLDREESRLPTEKDKLFLIVLPPRSKILTSASRKPFGLFTILATTETNIE